MLTKMKITAKEWVLFILIAIFGFLLWFKFGYPQFSFVDLSIDRKEALKVAKAYLESGGVETKTYLKVVVFNTDDWADRYLQKTIGLKAQEEFIRQHNYELFSWVVRFFKPFQKEEYLLEVSPKSGKILSFRHLIEDIAAREEIDKELARNEAERFLTLAFGVNLKDYNFHEEKVKRYDLRTDYSFSWEQKDVYIPWKKGEGGAKLLIGATVSGKEIRQFFTNTLDVPEKFYRYIDNQFVFGEYLTSFYFIVFILLIICAVFILLQRRQSVVSNFSKKWFFALAIFLVVVNLIFIFNNFESVLIKYTTSVSYSSFISIYLIKALIGLGVLSATFILPGLAGENLRSETLPDKPYCSFLHYLRSTFFSRTLTKAILLGYLLFLIMLGLQAVIFYFGQKYLGVWKEWLKLTQFSSAYIPFLSAFAIAIVASLNEEVIFRLFGITWCKKYLKQTFLAVIVTALIWGFGHSGYAIFPVWFRGIEVSILGIFFGFIFFKYGIAPLLIAHYLFDVFWGVAAYILGKSSAYLFSGSTFVLAIPLIFATIIYFVNQKEEEREMALILDQAQRYNLEILKVFILTKKSQGLATDSIRGELLGHHWDPLLVDLAIKELF